MHFAAPTFARTTPAKTRTTPAKPRKRPQIPFLGYIHFLQISLWRGQFNQISGWLLQQISLGRRRGLAQKRVGCRLIRIFNSAHQQVSVQRRLRGRARGAKGTWHD